MSIWRLESASPSPTCLLPFAGRFAGWKGPAAPKGFSSAAPTTSAFGSATTKAKNPRAPR
jgi:hypothetical protein